MACLLYTSLHRRIQLAEGIGDGWQRQGRIEQGKSLAGHFFLSPSLVACPEHEGLDDGAESQHRDIIQ